MFLLEEFYFLKRAYVQVWMYGENSLSDNNFIQGIQDYLPMYEQKRILRIISSFSHLPLEDTDFLLDFASRRGVVRYPTRNNEEDIV